MAKQPIRLERVQGVLHLFVGDDCQVRFNEQWVKDLKAIPNGDFKQCMYYYRKHIDPKMSQSERKYLRRADITQLPKLIQDFII